MSWSFLREPKWIARHVAVAALVVTMVLLGLWQLRRLDEKRDHVALVESRRSQPVVDVLALDLADEEVASAAADQVEHLRVIATGAYEDADTVVVEHRSLNGAAGGWVLTPLRLGDGTAVVVNRGFVGFDREGLVTAPPAPGGRVDIEGLVMASQRRGSFGPTDPADGTLDVLARADLERFQQQVDYDLLPVYVQRLSSEPPEPAAAEGAPQIVALDPAELSEGPHLGYAVQWFTFTTIAVVGYALLLRRVARDRAAGERATAREGDRGEELTPTGR